MNNIVIVEDKLKKGISLAEQFIELGGQQPELELCVIALCYFKANQEKAQEEIDGAGKQKFEIVPVSLWNFNEVMDKYMNQSKDRTTIIMDYLLDGDGSEGVPLRRVNIRYARKPERKSSKQLWFYTGTGSENRSILCELVGEERVLEVKDSKMDYLRLNLTEDKFLKTLKENAAAGE